MKSFKIGLSQINNSFSGAHYLPYAAGLLESYLREHGKKPERFEFIEPLFCRMPIEQAVEQFKDADIVGFSLYSWNEKLSLSIAKRLKEENPDLFVVFGGPQVPDRIGTFLQDHDFIDVAVHGEGEVVFTNILDNIDDKDFSSILGISYRDAQGQTVTNLKPSRIKDLEIIPSPYTTGVFDEMMAKYPETEWLILWETNRGCPFKCTFCDWGSATQAKVHQFNMDRLKAEMDWFSEKKVEFIFCCDANFGILQRDVDIAKYTAKIKQTTGFPHALSVQNTKNATDRAYLTQKILADVGLNKGVTLSMQSLDETTLANIKRDNISLDTYEILQKRFTDDGVPTYSDLILAMPGETYTSFVKGISKLIENGQHNRIQFNNLSVLPNAEMGDPAYLEKFGMELVETKILNMHGALNDDVAGVAETQELVVATTTMPEKDWCQTRAISWMTAFLHFDKILQIPLIMMHEKAGLAYDDLLEAFMNVPEDTYPLIAKTRDYFISRARVIQDGGPEYEFSEEWLDIWWPQDEFMLIMLVTNNEIDDFYAEAKALLQSLIHDQDKNIFDILDDAIILNQASLKLPFQTANQTIDLHYNLPEFYKGVLTGKPVDLSTGQYQYVIQRSEQSWNDWQVWCKEVVWFANKKGAYLYGTEALDKYYAGHH